MTRLLTALLVLAPAVVLAAGGGGDAAHASGPDWAGLARHALNLAVLIFVLQWALKTPVGDFLKFRRNEIKDQLEASEAAKAEAEARFAELQDRLAGFEAELADMTAQIASDAEAERARILEQAKASAEQIKDAARRTADEELRRARTALRAEAVDLAVTMAGEILSVQVGKDDQKRLNDQYMAKLEEVAS